MLKTTDVPPWCYLMRWLGRLDTVLAVCVFRLGALQINTGAARRGKAFDSLFSLSMGCLSQLGSSWHSTYCWVKLCHGQVVCSQVKEKLLVELLQVHVSSAVSDC